MYKSISTAIIVLAVLAFTSGSWPVDASTNTPLGPTIVTGGKFVNQTAPIPTTTILTPKRTGLYRVSVYLTLTTNNPSSNSCWSFNLNWSDDAGAEQGGPGCLFGGAAPPYAYQNGGFGGQVLTFEVTAGSPLTYSVVQYGPPDNTAYSLYFVVEQIGVA